MPFTFKLSKRLALTKAARLTAARAVCVVRPAPTDPAHLPASPDNRHAAAAVTPSPGGARCGPGRTVPRRRLP